MKKVLAIVLALIMVFGLIACGEKEETPDAPATTPDAPATTPDNEPVGDDAPAATVATPNMNEDGTPNLDKIGHYDPDYDYSQNPQYRFSYHAYNADVLYQQSAYAYEAWAKNFNLKWDGFVSANNDGDMYLTNLQTALDQGTEMFVLDPDITLFPTIVTMLEAYPEVTWMSQMGTPRDLTGDGTGTDGIPMGGEMYTAFVGFDYYGAGYLCVEKLAEWKEANLPDLSWEEIGCFSYTLTLSPPLHQRALGAQDAWADISGCPDSFFMVDVASVGLTIQGGIDAAAPVLSTNTQYKAWLIFGLIDDLAIGAASVVDTMDLTDMCCITCIGGPGLQAQFDAGQQNAFRYAYCTPNLLYAEPILGAIYAFKMGWATPDTIWPSWVKASDNGPDDHTYPNLLLPSMWVEYSNYQEYFEWTDIYAGTDYYDYPQDGITFDTFSPFVEVPEGWND